MRLIDADKANEAVRKVLRKYGFLDESIVSDEVWDAVENEVPTSYDLDKVVERLEELRHPYRITPEADGLLHNFDYYIEKAIEIVKGAVKDE